MTILTLDMLVAAIGLAPTIPTMTTRIIGIDGGGGAGKSTLAARLAASMDGEIIHTDDFASWDNPLDWHARLTSQVLDPLSQNRPGRYQRYDWGTRSLAEWHDVEVGGTVILEGVSALRRAFRPVLSFAIFVDTPRLTSLSADWRETAEQALELWQDWQNAEDDYLERESPAAFADVILNGTLPLP